MRHPAYGLVRAAVAPLVRAAYRLQVRGAENVPADGGLIVAADHHSLLDPFVLGTALPRDVRFVAKAELWRAPLLGPLLDSLGGIPVERGTGDRGAVATAVAALERGEVVGIFPQGAVRRPGPWLRGAARMALATGAPLLPVRLLGTELALSPGHVGLPRLAVLIGTPIAVEPAKATIARSRELTVLLQREVERLGT